MKLVILVVAALGVALLAGTPADATKRKPTCAAKGSKTVTRTRDVRVWTERARVAGETVTQYYGCLRSVGKPVFLTANTGDDVNGGTDVTGVKVSGRYVGVSAVSDTGCARVQQCEASNPDGVTGAVTVTDLRRQRTLPVLGSGDPVLGFVVTQRGGFAVLSTAGLIAMEKGGSRFLDVGPIDARTLRAEVSIVSWIRDGVERFARLR